MVLNDVFLLIPIIIVTGIVEMERFVKPPILNPPRQFALVNTLELILHVLVQFVVIIIPSVYRMKSVLSLFLLLGVSRNTATVIIFIVVIMVIVLFRTILHITGPANVITAKLLIIVGNLVEMRLASISNPVCIQSTTRTNIVFPMMTNT